MSMTHQFFLAAGVVGLIIQVTMWKTGPVIADRLVAVIEISPDKAPQYYVLSEPVQP